MRWTQVQEQQNNVLIELISLCCERPCHGVLVFMLFVGILTAVLPMPVFVLAVVKIRLKKYSKAKQFLTSYLAI